MKRIYDKQIIKVDIPFTRGQASVFKAFLDQTGRKAGPFVKTVILAALQSENLQNLSPLDQTTPFCPGLERIRLNLRNPETKIADPVQAEAIALANEALELAEPEIPQFMSADGEGEKHE